MVKNEVCHLFSVINFNHTLLDVQGQHVWEEVCQVTGRCLCLAAAANEWCSRIQRLFFLNEGFDLTRQDILLHSDHILGRVRHMYTPCSLGPKIPAAIVSHIYPP